MASVGADTHTGPRYHNGTVDLEKGVYTTFAAALRLGCEQRRLLQAWRCAQRTRTSSRW